MKEQPKKVYRDSDQDVSTWSKITLIKCPSCSQRAELKNKHSVLQTYDHEHAEINCQHCGFNKKRQELISYTMEVKTYCGNCGERIVRSIPGLKQPKKSIQLSCEHCGDSQTHEPRNIPQGLAFANQEGKTEDAFGASLWLQERFKNEVFWAFNHDHLKHIKEYISADLRNREGMSMVARLPQFVKEKGNRAALLKLIDKMWRK